MLHVVRAANLIRAGEVNHRVFKVLFEHAGSQTHALLLLIKKQIGILQREMGSILLQRLLTNSMEVSASREAASCAATRELPNTLWKLKVHCRIHKNPPTGRYSDPDKSDRYHLILSLEDPF
jgi:hypothetical protein